VQRRQLQCRKGRIAEGSLEGPPEERQAEAGTEARGHAGGPDGSSCFAGGSAGGIHECRATQQRRAVGGRCEQGTGQHKRVPPAVFAFPPGRAAAGTHGLTHSGEVHYVWGGRTFASSPASTSAEKRLRP
jgi:hypothetical protein